MKRGPDRQRSTANSKRARYNPLSIDDLPADMFNELFSHIGFEFKDLANIRLVNKEWKAHLDSYCRILIDRYFKYLKSAHPEDYETNPLGLVYREYRFYKQFPNLDMSDILAALTGNHAQISSCKDENSKAILYAIYLANGYTLPDILDDTPEFNLYIPSMAFAFAANNGDISFLKNYKHHLHSGGVAQALLFASRKGHVSIVQYLLDTFDTLDTPAELRISSQLRQKAYIEAASEGQTKVLKVLDNNIFSDETFDKALIKSAGNGYLKTVKFLIHTLNFEYNVTHASFREALSNGHLEVGQYLSKRGDDAIKKLQEKLLANGFSALAKKLLDDAIALNIDAMNEVLFSSAYKGYSHIVDFLFENYTFEQNIILEAFYRATRNGKAHIVPSILSKLDYNENNIEATYIIATRFGTLDILKLLIPKVKHRDDIIMKSILEAGKHGDHKLLEFLLGQKELGLHLRLKSLINLSREINYDVVKGLVYLGKVSPAEAIEVAIEMNDVVILDYYLQKAKANQLDANALMSKAIRMNHLPCVKLLVEKFNISINSYRINDAEQSYSILDYAIPYGDINMLKFILQQGQFDSSSLNSALSKAHASNRSDLVPLLLDATLFGPNTTGLFQPVQSAVNYSYDTFRRMMRPTQTLFGYASPQEKQENNQKNKF